MHTRSLKTSQTNDFLHTLLVLWTRKSSALVAWGTRHSRTKMATADLPLRRRSSRVWWVELKKLSSSNYVSLKASILPVPFLRERSWLKERIVWGNVWGNSFAKGVDRRRELFEETSEELFLCLRVSLSAHKQVGIIASDIEHVEKHKQWPPRRFSYAAEFFDVLIHLINSAFSTIVIENHVGSSQFVFSDGSTLMWGTQRENDTIPCRGIRSQSDLIHMIVHERTLVLSHLLAKNSRNFSSLFPNHSE